VVEIEPLVEDIPEIEVDQDSKLDAARTQATHHILSEHIKGGIQVSAASHERVETLAKQILNDREKAEKNSQKVLEKLAKEEQ
jgi:Ser-tRNA(Ala) deacylase AlaX